MIIICNLKSHLKQKRNISNSYFRFKLACLPNWCVNASWSNFEILFHCFVFAFVLFINYLGGGCILYCVYFEGVKFRSSNYCTCTIIHTVYLQGFVFSFSAPYHCKWYLCLLLLIIYNIPYHKTKLYLKKEKFLRWYKKGHCKETNPIVI